MTIKWLEKYNIEYDKLILTNAYDSEEKAKVCSENNISIMIDDTAYELTENNHKITMVNHIDVNKVYTDLFTKLGE